MKANGDCMCVEEFDGLMAATNLRIEVIDSWHKQWPSVLDDFAQHGRRERLMVDADGWLSARQVVLVAYVGDSLAGHLVFRLVPEATTASSSTRRKVDANLDSFEVTPGFDDAFVRDVLIRAATQRAKALRVEKLRGI